LAVARFLGEHLLSHPGNQVAWARLPNGFHVKVDLRWRGGYDSLYYFRTYEPPLAALIRRSLDTDGASFVDVGANVGVFCFWVADVLRRREGRAVAIEPLPANYEFLVENIRANGLGTVIDAVPVAVGDAPGELTLWEHGSGTIANAVPLAWHEAAAEVATRTGAKVSTVPMSTVDDIVSARALCNVQFVKVDIEGAELFALRGAAGLLSRDRPLVYAECHREFLRANGVTPADVAAFATGLGFRVAYLRSNGRVVSEGPEEGSRFLDLVLIPQHPSAHQQVVLDAVQS
jgi:FkbM family methyltransferase